MYLIPNLSLKCDRLSIHSFLLLGPRHHAIPQNQRNSFLAERKQIADRGLFCRNLLKKPSFCRTDSSPRWTHRSDSLPYQILVLTAAPRPAAPPYAPPAPRPAGEGRTEGGGEGRQGGRRAYLVREEEERGREAGRPADLRRWEADGGRSAGGRRICARGREKEEAEAEGG
jgi:hypothetical protein